MEESKIADMFGALAHPTRVAILRQLMLCAPDSMAAGVIAELLATPPSSLSHHLAGLERVGLIASERQQRNILYAAVPDRIRELVTFFIDDCCDGRAELCLPAHLLGSSCA